MNIVKKISRSQKRGFSLVETTVALGMFSLLIMPVIGLINVGVTQSNSALNSSSLQSIRDSVRHRLTSQKNWPSNSSAKQWTSDISFSRDGSILPNDSPAKPFVKVRLTSSPSSSYTSEHLEVVQCEYLNPRDESSVATCVIQRQREP
jgi:uncharacterized protein (TIGR02598 family)